MITFVHELIDVSVKKHPNKNALCLKSQQLSYQDLDQKISAIASCYQKLNIQRHDRIGIYLHKTFETVTCIFACSKASAVFVPINANLKAPQVEHIIDDCDMQLLITNQGRYNALKSIIINLPSLKYIILIDGNEDDNIINNKTKILSWQHFISNANPQKINLPLTGNDMAAILYTSGSTGKPKGVVLSHNNIVLGAQSVAKYLENTSKDIILAVLPLSFDYGLSQITTSFLVGASCVLLDYLLPHDVIKTIEKYQVTGLAAVPSLWVQLCKLNWSENDGNSIRYFTNSGGILPTTNLAKLRKLMPQAAPFLMYGLTEAFRSTYLHPNEIDKRIGSMGKAIPNAEVIVVRKDGTVCNIDEPGELVHKGPLVALGYWNTFDKSAEIFKTAPQKPNGLMLTEIAVWSGDIVKKDQDGYLYFVARQDEMIKTSGYRVSPMEIEESLYQHPDVEEAAIIGVTHHELGQAVLAIVSSNAADDSTGVAKSIIKYCQLTLANYMVPKKVIILDLLPHNANEKIDRSLLHKTYKNYFTEHQ